MTEDATLDKFVDRNDLDSSSREIEADSWSMEKLKDHTELVSGAHVKSDNVHSDNSGTAYLTGPEDFEGLGFRVTKYTNEPTNFCESEDTLVTVKGSGCGKSAFSNQRACISRQLKALRPNSSINPLHLYYSVKSRRRFLETLSEGSAIPGLSNSHLTTLDIPVPSLGEQRKIASVLYNVDQAIQTTGRIIDQIDHLRRGVVQNLLTEGARNHTAFTDSKTGKQPAEWDYVPFEDLLVDTRYGTDQKSNSDAIGYPTLRIPNIVGKRITLNDLKHTELDESEFDRLRLKDGDILIVRTNGNPDYVGQCATFSESEDDFVFASYLIRLRVDEERVSPVFIREFLNSSRGRSEMNGWIRSSAGNYNLSVGAIEKFRVPVPSLEEQAEIVGKIRAVEKAASMNRDHHQRLKHIKRGLMQDLLSGEVRTTNADIKIPDEVLAHG